MPSVQSAAAEWKSANPALAAFINGAEYAQNLPAATGSDAALKDFNSQLGQLKSKDPKALLDTLQANLEPVLAG